MNAQNIKTAASKSTERWVKGQNKNVNVAATAYNESCGEKPYHPGFSILMAEGIKGQEPAEFEVYEFSSLDELRAFRTTCPEKMKGEYSYVFTSGTRKDGSHVNVASAVHFKQFARLLRATGIKF